MRTVRSAGRPAIFPDGVRFQMILDPAVHTALVREARRRRVSAATLGREAIINLLKQPANA